MFSCTKTCDRLKSMTSWRNVTCWLVPMLIFWGEQIHPKSSYAWIPRHRPLNKHPLRASKKPLSGANLKFSHAIRRNFDLPSKYDWENKAVSSYFSYFHTFSAQLNFSTIKSVKSKKWESRNQSLTWLQCKCQASAPKKEKDIDLEPNLVQWAWLRDSCFA